MCKVKQEQLRIGENVSIFPSTAARLSAPTAPTGNANHRESIRAREASLR